MGGWGHDVCRVGSVKAPRRENPELWRDRVCRLRGPACAQGGEAQNSLRYTGSWNWSEQTCLRKRQEVSLEERRRARC